MSAHKIHITKYLIVSILTTAIKIFGYAQDNSSDESFQQIRNEVRRLWSLEKFDDAINMLKEHKSDMIYGYANFTYHYYLGLLYLEKSDAPNGFRILNEGMDKGYFYALYPDRVEQIKQYDGADALLAKNHELKSFAQDTATAKVDISLPVKYDPHEKYPLIIFLHGNNSTLELAKKEWRDVQLNKSAIVAFAQSSSPVSSYAYNWPDSERSKSDLKKCLAQIQEFHQVEDSQVVIAGFSAGGRIAIDAVINDWLPSIGFIAISPAKPNNLTAMSKGNVQNKRGYIFHGKKDYLYSEQQELITHLKENRFSVEVQLDSNIGHEYPNELDMVINQALKYVLLIQ